MDNNIKFLLGIHDKNITWDEKYPKQRSCQVINGQSTTFWHTKLVLPANPNCSICGKKMRKIGFKFVHTKLMTNINGTQILSLRKQRYLCSCGHSITAHLQDVQPYCHIADKVKAAIATDLSFNISMKDIALRYNISVNTVMRLFKQIATNFKVNFNKLPNAISFDDFSSGKFADKHMSINLIDANTHKIIDIIRNRGSYQLEKYFTQYSLAARKQVQFIIIDLFKPYRPIIKRLFPNAKIIADKFHVITQVYMGLEKIRRRVMNSYPKLSHERKIIQKYRRILLKNSDDLDYLNYYSRRSFSYSHLNQIDIVNRILSLSDELGDAYDIYQQVLYAMKHKNIELLNNIIFNNLYSAPFEIQQALLTLKRHYQEIINSFIYSTYSNGPIEGINNRIKVIKRVAFGYRNFNNFRIRIMLQINFSEQQKLKQKMIITNIN